jgi:hypothetical protein
MQEQISEKEEEVKLFEAKIAASEKEIQWKKQVRTQSHCCVEPMVQYNKHGPYNHGSYNHGPYYHSPYNHCPYNHGPYNHGPYNHCPYNHAWSI